MRLINEDLLNGSIIQMIYLLKTYLDYQMNPKGRKYLLKTDTRDPQSYQKIIFNITLREFFLIQVPTSPYKEI